MFTEKTFNIPPLTGLSQKSIEEHIKLYQGYVKHANLILEKMSALKDEAYAVGEMQRRFGFEFDGMRNHEYYFASLEGGAQPLSEDFELRKKIAETWGSFDAWLERFKAIAMTRGIGWAMLYHDPVSNTLVNAWIDEQHLGHLTGLKPVLALDMWEHSFVLDYLPSGKKQYVEDFFANLNWKVIEENFKNAQ